MADARQAAATAACRLTGRGGVAAARRWVVAVVVAAAAPRAARGGNAVVLGMRVVHEGGA